MWKDRWSGLVNDRFGRRTKVCGRLGCSEACQNSTCVSLFELIDFAIFCDSLTAYIYKAQCCFGKNRPKKYSRNIKHTERYNHIQNPTLFTPMPPLMHTSTMQSAKLQCPTTQAPRQFWPRRALRGGAIGAWLNSSSSLNLNSSIKRSSRQVCGTALSERISVDEEEEQQVDQYVEMSDEKKDIQRMLARPYKYGFKTLIDSDTFPKGLDEDVVRAISAKKKEPEWMLEFRLKAYKRWLTMKEPEWSDNHYPAINYQDLSYYSEPRQKEKKASLDEVDPELLRTFDKLGISLNEQKRLSNVAVDIVFDSVSIATTFRADLLKHGVIFCSISEAIKEYPELVKKYMGSVVSWMSICPTWICPAWIRRLSARCCCKNHVFKCL